MQGNYQLGGDDMIEFDISQIVPSFLMHDKNGKAMAKAIEAAMRATLKTIRQGIDTVINVEKMPEWRLDELAWEYNCLYDFSASIVTKRRWIRDAIPFYRIYGTPAAIYQYLEGVFEDIELEEWWQYFGKPYHFRVTVSGEWTDDRETWTRKAISVAKNVRSVLDSIAIGSRCYIKIGCEAGLLARLGYPMTGPSTLAGTTPQENTLGKTAEGVFVFATDAHAHVYPYPMNGTRPDINLPGAVRTDSLRMDADGTSHRYPYPQTSVDARSGTHPDTALLGTSRSAGALASTQGQGHRYPYSQVSEDARSGTIPEINTPGAASDEPFVLTTDARAHAYPYPTAGTKPQENTLVALSSGGIRASPDEHGTAFPYASCGEQLCGQDDF